MQICQSLHARSCLQRDSGWNWRSWPDLAYSSDGRGKLPRLQNQLKVEQKALKENQKLVQAKRWLASRLYFSLQNELFVSIFFCMKKKERKHTKSANVLQNFSYLFPGCWNTAKIWKLFNRKHCRTIRINRFLSPDMFRSAISIAVDNIYYIGNILLVMKVRIKMFCFRALYLECLNFSGQVFASFMPFLWDNGMKLLKNNNKSC